MTQRPASGCGPAARRSTTGVHFSEPVVALGKVYVVTHDARVIAFGLRK